MLNATKNAIWKWSASIFVNKFVMIIKLMNVTKDALKNENIAFINARIYVMELKLALMNPAKQKSSCFAHVSGDSNLEFAKWTLFNRYNQLYLNAQQNAWRTKETQQLQKHLQKEMTSSQKSSKQIIIRKI